MEIKEEIIMDNKDVIIVVGVTELDQYGNLIVTDKDGNKFKIAAKRSTLHPLFQQGKAIMLHYETYMDKPYVASAKPVEGNLPAPVKPQQVPDPKDMPPKSLTELLKQETGSKPPDAKKTDPKNRAFALSYSKDISVAKITKGDKVTGLETLRIAELFRQYLDGEIDIIKEP